MKNKMNKKTIGLLVMALLLVASIGVGSALAYFTAYTEAKGGVTLSLKYADTEIKEEVVEKVKELVIANNGDEECYIRIKVIVSKQYQPQEGQDQIITYSEPDGLKNWTPGEGGYYYYKDIVAAKDSTTQLNVELKKLMELAKDDFNVIIIQESTPVLYNEDGKPYSNWDVKATVSETVNVTE